MEQDAWRQIGKRANDRQLGALEWPVPAIVIDMSQEIMIFLSWSLGYRITPRSALQMQIPLADPHLYALCASTQSRDSRPKGSKSKKMLIK